jgi:hypothetical protein
MTSYYKLQIFIDNEDKYLIINNILGIKSNSSPSCIWDITITNGDEDEYIPFIDYFLSILEGKYEQLANIGVTRENISIWLLYKYDGQCNMEFSPKDMKRLGEEGITLCISCWEK